jgi:hypothetical protein
MDVARWRTRGRIALLGICVAYAAVALGRSDRQLVDSDWTAFATGAHLAAGPLPGLLYDRTAQQRAQDAITGGGGFDLKGQGRLLPFLSPPWVALLAIPFDAAGFGWGGRLLILVGLAALLGGVALAAPADRWAPLAVAAGFPTLVLVLNAQLDGLVALGLGAAIAAERAGRPGVAGLALGLTLVKPHLVLPVAAAMLLARRWRLVAGWGLAALGLVVVASARHATWTWAWLEATWATVGRNGRELDPGTWPWLLEPSWPRPLLTLTLSLAVLALVLAVAVRRSREPWAALVAGGVLVAPHALPSDLVLVGLAMAIDGGAGAVEWWVFSVAAAAAAVTPDPWPSVIATALIGSLLLRMARPPAGRSPRCDPRRPFAIRAAPTAARRVESGG